MANNDNLFNAAMVGENPEGAFIVEGKRLHAVERAVANLKKDAGAPKLVLPLLRDAFQALIKFSEGKIPKENLDFISLKPNELDQLIEKLAHLYSHLPHHDRNELSSLIHHKQTGSKKR